MKRCLLPLIAAVLLSTAPAGETAVRAAVNQFNEAAHQGNQATLEKLLASGLVYGHSSAKIENKAECVAALVKSKPNFVLDPGWTVQVYGKSAVVHGKMTAGQNRLDLLQVWVQEGGGWQMVARHTTKLP